MGITIKYTRNQEVINLAMDMSYGTIQRILIRDLHLHAYKIKLTQQLKPLYHLERGKFVNLVLERDNHRKSSSSTNAATQISVWCGSLKMPMEPLLPSIPSVTITY